MKSILMCCDWYYPAYKAGGPIQSIHRLAVQLTPYYKISILTSAYDLNSETILSGIRLNEWFTTPAGIQVYYTTRDQHRIKNISDILKTLRPDFIYFYSPFSKKSTIDVIRACTQAKISPKYILAPKGTLKKSALKKSHFKKWVYIKMIKWFGWHRTMRFHATNADEQAEINTIFGETDTHVIYNLPPVILSSPLPCHKEVNHLKLLCLSRIHPIKNIHFLIETMQKVSVSVDLTILGGIEDEAYYDKCQHIARQLPNHIRVQFAGDCPYAEVESYLQQHHIMALPTLGENYGNAIVEALAIGRPVMISDQTPWKGLSAHKAGWDLPIAYVLPWQKVIEECGPWDQATYNEWSHGALTYAQQHIQDPDLIHQYQQLFN